MSRFRFTDELDKARALLAEAKTIIDNLEDTSDSVDMSVLENADEPLQTIIDAIVNRPALEAYGEGVGRLDAAATDPLFADRLDDPAIGVLSDLALPDAGSDINDLALQAVVNEWAPAAD